MPSDLFVNFVSTAQKYLKDCVELSPHKRKLCATIQQKIKTELIFSLNFDPNCEPHIDFIIQKLIHCKLLRHFNWTSKHFKGRRTTASQAPVSAPISKPTYANKAAGNPKATVATAPTPAPKSKKSTEKKQLERSRNVKATTRFMIEIPSGVTVTNAKSEVWETVKTKLKNPRAKTIVSGQTLVIIPDDSNTLEVMKGLKNVIEISPRKPRVIIYDVDSGISKEELAECLLDQNPELGLTADDVRCMTPLHKLGPRNSDVVHWVIEAPPNVLAKLENKSLYIGMTRCRCKLHSSTPQCFKCQQYGHTSLRCEQKTPTCRNCAGALTPVRVKRRWLNVQIVKVLTRHLAQRVRQGIRRRGASLGALTSANNDQNSTIKLKWTKSSLAPAAGLLCPEYN